MLKRLEPINAIDAKFAQRIFDTLIANPGITEAKLAKLLHTYPRAVKPMLERMIDRECVVKTSTGFLRTYAVSGLIHEAAKLSATSVEVHKPLSLDYLRMMAFVMTKRT
jgi:hypothetical protein